MRILHTSDWHLGKRLYKESRLPEQRLFLEWLKKTIIDERIDILLIAGDIFDSPTPPTDALTLYFNFLESLSSASQVSIYILAGNHDSGKFLEAPKLFLQSNRIHVVGTMDILPEEDLLKKLHFKVTTQNLSVDLFMLPYFRTHEIFNFQRTESDEISLSDLSLQQQLERLFETLSKAKTAPFSILAMHHQVGSYEPSASEQSLSLSGLSTIPTSLYKSHFDYLALGHIHKPQRVSKTEEFYYSGSPIPLRFSESNHKSINLIEISDKLRVEIWPIPVFRELKSFEIDADIEEDFEDSLKTIIKQSHSTAPLPAYLEIIVKTQKPSSALYDQIRLAINEGPAQLLTLQTIQKGSQELEKTSFNMRHLSNEELFYQFYQSTFAESPSREIVQTYNEVLDEIAESIRGQNEDS